jgi:uncharacterized protein
VRKVVKVNKKNILEKIEKEKSNLKKKGVKKIGLFGSFAKGTQHKKSDIDILVKFDEPSFEKYAELLILLEKLFRRKIDLIIESNLRKELSYVKKEAEYVKL